MREIKFRYTFKRKSDNHIYQIIVPLGIFEDGHGQIFSMLNNDLWEVIARDQYTGLKDKNGKEIYEGDILKIESEFDDREFILPVEFIAGMFEVRGSGLLCHNPLREIIGNIYENKELIEDKK